MPVAVHSISRRYYGNIGPIVSKGFFYVNGDPTITPSTGKQ